MGLHAEAQDAYEKALTHSPDNYAVLGNLGVSLTSEYKLDHAETVLKKALLICPEMPGLIVNLCNCLRLQGHIDEVVNILESALLINPNSIELHDNLLYNLNFIDAYTPQDSFDIAKKFGDILESNIRLFKDKTPLNNKRFKVGLVSADFKSHPVSYFLINILPFIDLARFDLIAYTNSGGIDNITHELRTYFTDWYSVHDLNDEAASELIYGHDLNLLIDLSGHTKGNRLAIFAKRVAPVQVSWLGYFGTTGIKNMDYFLADEVGVPAKNQAFFSEKIKYLPNTRLCFSVPNLSIEITPLPALNNNFVTFGCFQSAAKLNDRSIKLFVKVLKKVTNAKLRIQNGSLSDESVISNLRDRFYLAGIDPKRLILLPGVDRNRYFLAHDDVDMILDTFPFNGGTTTCEALWMGVPTLTLAGDTLIARQGASLLLAAGLDNWVANSEDEFVDKAVSLSSNLKSLSILRHSLRTQVLSSPLFDGPLFAKNLENAFLEMWQEKTNTLNFLNPTVDCDDQFDSLESQDVIVVSATRLTEFEFWSKSALGLSLKKHQSRDKRIHTAITFENKRGLPDIYNDQITNEIGAPILAFIHDDVWIDEPDFVDKVIQGLRTFDIIGVAGNRRLVECQPAWSFLNDNFIWDTPENLTGAISHGRSAFGDISVYGDSPAPSKLLDGVFLAVHKNILLDSNVYFDSSFKFHFYDMDFCRAASKAGLSLGSYPIRLTHQSSGAFGSFEWREAYYKYLAKWDEIDLYNNKNIVEKEKSEFERSIENVIVFAKQHFKAGNFDEAKNLLDEVLLYSPGYAEAKNLMELININKNT
jgi:predicted O-linked N-acetylglucosamine transferase (SPINDLY family)